MADKKVDALRSANAKIATKTIIRGKDMGALVDIRKKLGLHDEK